MVLAVALLAVGCGRDQTVTVPAGCEAGAEAVSSALASAPAGVTVEGTPLSDCLVARSEASDVQQIGSVYLSVASRLAADARANPQGPAATQLGYLMGAVTRGAGRTQGIHSEILRRLEQELTLVDTQSPAYRRGREAGLEDG